jgi:hypothetical protein
MGRPIRDLIDRIRERRRRHQDPDVTPDDPRPHVDPEPDRPGRLAKAIWNLIMGFVIRMVDRFLKSNLLRKPK